MIVVIWFFCSISLGRGYSASITLWPFRKGQFLKPGTASHICVSHDFSLPLCPRLVHPLLSASKMFLPLNSSSNFHSYFYVLSSKCLKFLETSKVALLLLYVVHPSRTSATSPLSVCLLLISTSRFFYSVFFFFFLKRKFCITVFSTTHRRTCSIRRTDQRTTDE